MVIVRTVKLRKSWYYKKSSSTLRIDTYSKEEYGNEYDYEWLRMVMVTNMVPLAIRKFCAPIKLLSHL